MESAEADDARPPADGGEAGGRDNIVTAIRMSIGSPGLSDRPDLGSVAARIVTVAFAALAKKSDADFRWSIAREDRH